MDSQKRILKNISKNYRIDPDEVLVTLWDNSDRRGRFDYLKNENSIVKRDDIPFVKDILRSKSKNEEIKKKDSSKNKIDKIQYKNFNFSLVGKSLEQIKYPDREDLLKIHKELTLDFGSQEDPIEPSGLKNSNMLDSAIFHAQTSFERNIKYPTIETAAAALMYSISLNHAFHNGNKRTAMVAMLVFLDRHNIFLTCGEDELFRLSVMVADRKMVEAKFLYSDAEIFELAKWIHSNSRTMSKEERSITLRRFKQILTTFDCQIMENGRVKRIIKTKRFFGPKSQTLISKKPIFANISDGDDIDKGLIKSIREDLQLNHEYNIDSDTFYLNAEFSTSEFILRYKSLLRRLSKI